MRIDHDTVPVAQPPREQILQAARQTLHQLDHEEALARRQDDADSRTSGRLLKVLGLAILCLTILALAISRYHHTTP